MHANLPASALNWQSASESAGELPLGRQLHLLWIIQQCQGNDWSISIPSENYADDWKGRKWNTRWYAGHFQSDDNSQTGVQCPCSGKGYGAKKKPGSGFSPPECEIYPLFPIHTMEYAYEADDKPDEGDSEHCNKDYNESATISGGITHITCQHSICKGFTAIGKGTS